MAITKQQLKTIIREELQQLFEADAEDFTPSHKASGTSAEGGKIYGGAPKKKPTWDQRRRDINKAYKTAKTAAKGDKTKLAAAKSKWRKDRRLHEKSKPKRPTKKPAQVKAKATTKRAPKSPCGKGEVRLPGGGCGPLPGQEKIKGELEGAGKAGLKKGKEATKEITKERETATKLKSPSPKPPAPPKTPPSGKTEKKQEHKSWSSFEANQKLFEGWRRYNDASN